jgi:gliding motility-associated-like protein
MRKKLLFITQLIVFILLFAGLFSNSVFATHVQGGNLTYTCLGGNQYEVTLALYRDCAGVSAPTSVSIRRKSVSCNINTTFTLNKIAGTGIEVSPICPNSHTTCTGGSLPGVQEYLYKGVVTLPPCSDWVLSFVLNARNNAITTITNPGGQDMYIEATLNNLAFPCNNSPQFTNKPVPFICVGQTYCFNNGSNDVDGDSLSYSLVTPHTSATTFVTYTGGYSASQPMASNPAATFNPQTGDMCVKPTMLQVTVLAMLVKEWRNGVLVGSIMRDIQIRTVTCTNNNPSLNGINNTGVYSINACAGVPLTLNIPSFDVDGSQNVTLTWNSGITGAIFNPGTGTRPTGVFSWTPTLADVDPTPHCFTVTVKDNACPFLGNQSYSFCIKVGGYTATTSSTNTICTSAHGSASVNLTGGLAPVTYHWTPSGGNNSSATNLAAGSYTCAISDATGCAQTKVVTIGSTPGGTASISSFTNVTCNGANNGTVTVTMNGAATPPFTYAWTPVSAGTTANAVNLGPNTYSVTVTDANGCTSSTSKAITQPAALTVNSTFTNIGCYGGTTGTATANASGGTGPYSYLWLPGAFNTASISSLSVGTYTVGVTDANGCTTSGTAHIVQPPALAISATTTQANCGQTNASSTVTGTGGFAPYTWSWTNGQTGTTATGLASGTYTVTITDLNLCTASIPVSINNISGPTATITSFNNVACFGGNNGNATIGMTGGSPPYTFLWSNGQTTPTASNLIAGVYSVSATDANGCIASTNVSITEPGKLITNAVSSNPVCYGNTDGTATASAVGGTSPYNYIWTASGSPTTSLITGLSVGSYSVTVTDAHGCIKNASVTLVNPPTLSTSITVVNTSCKNRCDGTATASVLNGIAPYTFLWNNPFAQTTPIATGLCAGSFTVVATDANGCQAQGVATITEPPLLTDTVSSTGNLTCYNVCTGFAQVTTLGGTAPYSYNWLPGGITNATASSLCAGSFTCTVTDAKGCTANTVATITQPDQLIATVSGTDITCPDSCNGTGNIAFSGGTGPYTALWTPSMQTIFNPNHLCPGVNIGRVTDVNGCSVVDSVTLLQPANPLVVSASITNSNCGQPNGGACAVVNGGFPPYTYIWNDSSVTQAACMANVHAGIYSIDVMDSIGCLTTTIISINDIFSPTVTVPTHTDLVCYGQTNGTATASISGGVGPYTEVWTPGGQTITNPINLAGGINTITVTDHAGCVSSVSVTIVEPPPINHAISAKTNVSCFGVCDGTATVSAAGGTGLLSYVWNNPSAQTSATATGLCAGNWKVTITDGNACSTIDSSTIITQPDSVSISTSTTTNLHCFSSNDGSITPTVIGGTPFYTFAWTPSGGNSTTANALAAGTYTLTVQDQKGCSTNRHWTLTEPALLTFTSSFTPTTCEQANGTATIVPTGGTTPYTYQWNDNSLQTTATASTLLSGTYNAVVTDSHNCITSNTFTVNDISGPVIDSIATTKALCFNGATGTATVALVNNTGTPPFTYLWNQGNQTTVTATNLAHGLYNVTVTDSNGCVVTGVASVEEPSLLQLFVSATDTICPGDTAQIYATAGGGTPAYTYSWIAPAGNGFNGSGPFIVMPAGSTVYTATLADNNGCNTGNIDISVFVKPSLTIAASDTTICPGDSVQISVTTTSGNSGAYTYSWDNGSTAQSQEVTPLAGVATTNYIVTVSDGCSSASDTSSVSTYPASITSFQATPSKGCEPLTISFTATSNNGVTYAWNYGDGSTGAESVASYTYHTPGVYDVILTVTTANGCTSVIDSLAYVTVYPNPTADFEVSQAASPFLAFTDLSTVTITNWIWNFGDQASMVDTSTAQNPTYQYPAPGTDTVSLIVTNQFGCVDSITKGVEVIEIFEFYVPNSFTPDENGVNDIFLPKGVGYDVKSFFMIIFDRWGNLIFSTNDYQKGWNGKANHGTDVAQIDTYVWKIELTDNKGIRHKYMGTVTLLK